MSFSNTAENAVLQQVFKGVALPWNSNTELWIALHTADPTETGTAVTDEANYGGYARIPLDRDTDITVLNNQIFNTNLEQFNQCSSGTNTITHASIVTTASGAGTIIVKGALNTVITVTTGIQPQFGAGDLVFELD